MFHILLESISALALITLGLDFQVQFFLRCLHPRWLHPAHNTVKVTPLVSNHLKTASEEYFQLQEFCFNEINHIKNKSMNKKIQFAEENRKSNYWNTLFEIGIRKQNRKSLKSTCGEISFSVILKPESQQLYYKRLLHKGSSEDSDQSFSCLLQFLRTLKNTPILQNILHGSSNWIADKWQIWQMANITKNKHKS